MAVQLVTEFYNNNAEDLVSRYESISFETVHQIALPYLPTPPAAVLDIGAGSGRDAAWFAENGYQVTAVEPAERMIELAQATHQQGINWVCDSLPQLGQLSNYNEFFDVILLSGVWMHIRPEDRSASLAKMHQLNKIGGILILSLRHGLLEQDRPMHLVSFEELSDFAREFGYEIILRDASLDKLNRNEISWETVILKK